MSVWKVLAVFITALLPISEVRGAIPLGMALGLSPATTFTAAIMGNFTPVPLLLALLGWSESFLKRRLEDGGGVAAKLAHAYFNLAFKARSRAKPYVNRYGAIGLALFTAIPLPFTGAWTSSLAAHILGMDRKVALISIWLGVMLAALVVSGLVGLIALTLP